jgi:hypothetical protein
MGITTFFEDSWLQTVFRGPVINKTPQLLNCSLFKLLTVPKIWIYAEFLETNAARIG